MTEDARRLLLAGLVDYAGLFPPAAESMRDAVARYGEYRRGAHAWALGKFVLPVARLAEFGSVARQVIAGGDPWQLALIAGADFGADIRVIEDFTRRTASIATVAAIEVKGATPDAIAAIARSTALLRANVPDAFDVYVEVPIANDPSVLVATIASLGLRAKVRTGGVEAGAFPTAAELVRFLTACIANDVTFKATAGLHHAMRGSYPLTYEAGSERGTMFGFLNVFLAGLFLSGGMAANDAQALLEERDAKSIAFDSSGVTWRGHTISAASIRDARAHAATSFGSCSFAEPVADLSSLGLL
jgi:hypothetical protein